MGPISFIAEGSPLAKLLKGRLSLMKSDTGPKGKTKPSPPTPTSWREQRKEKNRRDAYTT
jgi:hypothetical protein